MKPFNNQFATHKLRKKELDEEGSVTGPGEATLPRWTGPRKKRESKERGTGKGIIYKDLWEELNEIAIDFDISEKDLETLIQVLKGHLGTIPGLIPTLEKALGREVDPFPHLKENYSRFKKETKIKTESQQIHAAMRLAEKKLAEANRILEYTSQLRRELAETKYSSHTERVMERMVKSIAEAYQKMKSLK